MSFAELRLLAPHAGFDEPLDDPELARELTRKYFVFDAFVAGERRVDLHPLVLSAEAHRQAVDVAERVTRAIDEVAARAFVDEDEARRYGFAADVLTLARTSHAAGDRSALVRVDLLLGEDGRFQACEVNADCPGGHNEAVGLPALARRAGFRGGTPAASVVDALVDRLVHLARRDDGSAGCVALLHATAYAEDLQVCAFIERALAARGVRTVLAPPTAPRGRGDDVYVGDARVDVLYRYFPTETMEGQPNVAPLAQAIARGRVRSVSSFSQIFAQSKLAFARATAAGALEGLAPESHELPAFVLAFGLARLLDERPSWVVKRALGRVGEQVFVGALCAPDEWASMVAEVAAACAAGESWIVQRFLPQRRLHSVHGERLLTLGAYVLDGRFCGYFARVTPTSHVSHDALCVPVFVGGEGTA